MAKGKRKKLTEADRIIRFLKKQGFHKLTEEEKKLPWHQKDIAEFEAYLRQKKEERLGVRERRGSYRTKRTTKSKSHA
jgi:hypothetical protein